MICEGSFVMPRTVNIDMSTGVCFVCDQDVDVEPLDSENIHSIVVAAEHEAP